MIFIPKGKFRRELQDFIAYGRAEWELKFENDEFYSEARENGATIEPFDRAYVTRAIPFEYKGKQLRNDPQWSGDTGYLLLMISEQFVKECQQRVPRMRRLIEEFGND